MKVLLTGGSGKLGQEIQKEIQKLNMPHELYAPTRQEMDITNVSEVSKTITKHTPDIIIHCAALTNVEQCEHMQILAWKTNVEGTANLLNGCLTLDSTEWPYFIYVSTACVFKGDRGNYCELDMPNPTNFYGLTKLIGETLVRYSMLSEWLIVRTNFANRGKWPYPKAFIDRYGTWLYTDQVAEAILELISLKFYGVKHVCSKKKRSMYEFAHEDPNNNNVKPYTLHEHQYFNRTPLTVDMSLTSVIKTKGCCS